MKNRKGFTLIEMLVVVLIIGILAAVALPPYRRAVMRAKNREAMLGVRAIAQGIELYNLAKGPLPQVRSNDFSILDISVQESPNWQYMFFCYDEYKSCLIMAENRKVIAEVQGGKEWAPGKKYHTLSLETNEQGHAEFPIEIEENYSTIEEDENGEERTIYHSTSVVSPDFCRKVAGTPTEDGRCIVE